MCSHKNYETLQKRLNKNGMQRKDYEIDKLNQN